MTINAENSGIEKLIDRPARSSGQFIILLAVSITGLLTACDSGNSNSGFSSSRAKARHHQPPTRDTYLVRSLPPKMKSLSQAPLSGLMASKAVFQLMKTGHLHSRWQVVADSVCWQPRRTEHTHGAFQA